mgnify:CR=1 FL=1
MRLDGRRRPSWAEPRQGTGTTVETNDSVASSSDTMTSSDQSPASVNVTVPPDTAGRPYCAQCGLVVVAGDPRHTLPEAPTDDVQRRRAVDPG